MFTNMKIGMKALCAMILMALVVSLAGLVGIYGMNQMDQSRNEIAKVALTRTAAPEMMSEAHAANQKAERTFILFKGLLIGTMFLSVFLALAIGIVLYRDVDRIVGELTDEAGKLVKAAIGGSLAERGDPEKVNVEFRGIVKGINAMLDAILLPIGEGNRILSQIGSGNLREKMKMDCPGDHERMKEAVNGLHAWLSELVACVTKIANGDLTATIPKASKEDQIHEKLMSLRDNLQALVADTTLLAKSVADGNISTRADTAKHQGEFRKLVSGVNEILDTVLRQLKFAAEYLDRISKGEISPKISDKDKKDFNEIFLDTVAQNKPFFK
jgi:methyl-accepting chemotaxis protein